MKPSDFLKEKFDCQFLEEKIFSLNEQVLSYKFGLGSRYSQFTNNNKNHILILKSGKARLIDKSDPINEKTIDVFKECAVFDDLILNDKSLDLVSSSEDTEFISIDRSLLLNNELINSGLERSYKAIGKITNEDQSIGESLNESEVVINEDYQVSKVNSITPASNSQNHYLTNEFNSSAINSLEIKKTASGKNNLNNSSVSSNDRNYAGLEKFYKYIGLNFEENEQENLSLDSIFTLLDGNNGLKLEKKLLNWKELLNEDYPLLIEDEEKNLRWVTERAGNTLIDQSQGLGVRFIPLNVDSDNKFPVLSVKKLLEDQKVSDNEPYSYSWYFNIFCSNWLLSGQMLISALLVQFFSLGMPFFYLVIFDKVFGHQNLSALYVIAFGMVILSVFDLIVKAVRSYILTFQVEIMDKACIDLFLERLFHLPLSKINKSVIKLYGEGFNEIPKINQGIASLVFINSLDSITSLIVLVILFALNVQLSLVCLVAVVAISSVIFNMAKSSKTKEAMFAGDWRVSHMRLTESLNGIETIKALNASDIVRKKIIKKIDESSSKAFGLRINKFSEGNLVGWISNTSSLAILFFGAQFVLAGEISFGVYMAINMMSRIVIGNFQRLSTAIIGFQQALISIQKLQGLYREKDELDAIEDGIRLPAFKGKIEAINLSMKYDPKSKDVLRNLNFRINPSEKVVIVGKSGAGKSTLIRLLQRLYIQKSGSVLLDGYNIADIDLNCLRSSIGVAVQKPTIFGGSIRENIALARSSASMREIIDVVNASKLDKFIVKMPKGLDTHLEPLGSNLPNELTSLISLSRTFLQDPSILVIDGVIDSMNHSQRKYFTDYIFNNFKNRTCILVTDSIYTHEKADKILVLNEGEIVEQGNFNDLVQQQGYYYNLFFSHFEEHKLVENVS
ncbi:MAG: ABC transporter transmembrane domain-containing protein [Candidatus Caenarcaniphilales bacterium]|nr:ABC transporter transmembrane domain-containing protein [Candidatus Caenarcaniphilales bacterium]